MMIPILKKPLLERFFFLTKDELWELKQMDFGGIKFKTLWLAKIFDG